MNLLHQQGGHEAILKEVIELFKKDGFIEENLFFDKYAFWQDHDDIVISDLLDRPRLAVRGFKDDSIFKCKEILRPLFYVPQNQIVKFHDPAKSREYALIGKSKFIIDVRKLILQVVEAPKSLFISGEIGSGKTHLANVMVEEIRKKYKNEVIEINCLAKIDFKRDLVALEESKNKIVLLDYVESLSEEVIASLEKICQDNWVLLTARDAKVFSSLQYSGISIDVPPLIEREEDIELLTQYYLTRKFAHHFTLNEDILFSFKSKSYERNCWDLFHLLDEFSTHYQMKEHISWPNSKEFRNFDHQVLGLYKTIEKEVEELKSDHGPREILDIILERYQNTKKAA